jgi:membrane protein YdbS with pleckstrin-like domain
MPEPRVVRPSLKLVTASYIVVLLILAAAAYVTYGYLGKEFNPWHLLALVLLLLPLKKHLATRAVSLSVDNDHLTLESGLLSRTRRTMDLAKVQDVTARQGFGERLLGMGDLMVETAGERSAIVMEGIDRPREIADLILNRSRELVRARTHAPGV